MKCSVCLAQLDSSETKMQGHMHQQSRISRWHNFKSNARLCRCVLPALPRCRCFTEMTARSIRTSCSYRTAPLTAPWRSLWESQRSLFQTTETKSVSCLPREEMKVRCWGWLLTQKKRSFHIQCVLFFFSQLSEVIIRTLLLLLCILLCWEVETIRNGERQEGKPR